MVQFRSHALHGLRCGGELYPAKLRIRICLEIHETDAVDPYCSIQSGRICSRLHPHHMLPRIQQNTVRPKLPECKTPINEYTTNLVFVV